MRKFTPSLRPHSSYSNANPCHCCSSSLRQCDLHSIAPSPHPPYHRFVSPPLPLPSNRISRWRPRRSEEHVLPSRKTACTSDVAHDKQVDRRSAQYFETGSIETLGIL
ncbi:hypothetical protein CALVIDRAFT_542428 [Calocera viscosa TUFC12733]|uniref:Uncharacterized protein n=1 Tax=Calocera viscosa (strain TUFC12733) TaxID=1330018 RepID=A0A167GLC1_CALVF|nr:hypothetical protein CALVIDRAFT_542428 [Calocera viscosa TUFC12733]